MSTSCAVVSISHLEFVCAGCSTKMLSLDRMLPSTPSWNTSDDSLPVSLPGSSQLRYSSPECDQLSYVRATLIPRVTTDQIIESEHDGAGLKPPQLCTLEELSLCVRSHLPRARVLWNRSGLEKLGHYTIQPIDPAHHLICWARLCARPE